MAVMSGAAAALLLGAGCAMTDAAKAARSEASMQTLRTELIARGDADSLAASALFSRFVVKLENGTLRARATPESALDLATRAVAAAPDRIDLALEQLALCQQVPSCDSPALESRLLQLDPENGLPWAYALMRADQAKDQQAVRRARAALAQARRVDRHWTEAVTRMTAAVTGRAGFSAVEAFASVIGVEVSFLPALQPVSKACSAQEVQQPDVLAQCRQIAAAFRQGDSMLLASYGASLAQRFWPEGSVERAQAAAEHRAVHYWQDMWSRHSIRLNSLAAARMLARLYSQYPTEQGAQRELFVRLGLKPDPPADWVDPTPGG